MVAELGRVGGGGGGSRASWKVMDGFGASPRASHATRLFLCESSVGLGFEV